MRQAELDPKLIIIIIVIILAIEPEPVAVTLIIRLEPIMQVTPALSSGQFDVVERIPVRGGEVGELLKAGTVVVDHL